MLFSVFGGDGGGFQVIIFEGKMIPPAHRSRHMDGASSSTRFGEF